MSIGKENKVTKYKCEVKTVYFTTYCPDSDMTFVVKDKIMNDEKLIRREVISWYMGKPNKDLTESNINHPSLEAHLETLQIKVVEED